METAWALVMICVKFARIVFEAIFDLPRGRDVKKQSKKECSLCGHDMTDPSVKGCSEEELFYNTEGPVKPVPHEGDERCSGCGCAPGYMHHGPCPHEQCPLCNRAIMTCPCGKTDEELNAIFDEVAEERQRAKENQEKVMATTPLGGSGSGPRASARKAMLDSLNIRLGFCYSTKPTDRFPQGRIFEVLNIDPGKRELLVRLSPDVRKAGSFWIKTEVWKSWRVMMIEDEMNDG